VALTLGHTAKINKKKVVNAEPRRPLHLKSLFGHTQARDLSHTANVQFPFKALWAGMYRVPLAFSFFAAGSRTAISALGRARGTDRP
jgi:hypothetical protein